MHDSDVVIGGGHDEWLQAVARAQESRPSVTLDPIAEPFLGTADAISTGGGYATESPVDVDPVECRVTSKSGDSVGNRSSHRSYSSVTEDIANLIRRNPIPSLLIAVSVGWFLRRRQ